MCLSPGLQRVPWRISLSEGLGLALQVGDEVFRRNVRLPEKTSQSADFQFTVHWDDAALGPFAGNYMAATLTNLLEPETLKCLECLCAREARELRHALEC